LVGQVEGRPFVLILVAREFHSRRLSLSFNPEGWGSASALDINYRREHDGSPWTPRPNPSIPCMPSETRSTGASTTEPMPSLS
jgi:hypothetical protein